MPTSVATSASTPSTWPPSPWRSRRSSASRSPTRPCRTSRPFRTLSPSSPPTSPPPTGPGPRSDTSRLQVERPVWEDARAVHPIAFSVFHWILNLHGWVVLAVVFALPALEASAFVGFVFPGEIAVLLGGVLASRGRVSIAAVGLVA